MLLLRVVSALVGIPIVLGAVYLGGPWYATFMLLVVNLGIFEYCNLMKNKGYLVPVAVGFAGVNLFLVTVYFEGLSYIFPVIMLLFAILFVLTLFRTDRQSLAESSLMLWGITYLGGLGSYMILLRMLPDGAVYTYMLLSGVWLHDTAAYFIGKRWGMHKFAPLVSPNKTLEGSLAGIIATVTVAFSLVILAPALLPLNPGQALVFGLGIAVFAQLGDLLESALKRQLEVKDSGGLIPGHGGILDRFDSLFFCAPFIYYFFLLI